MIEIEGGYLIECRDVELREPMLDSIVTFVITEPDIPMLPADSCNITEKVNHKVSPASRLDITTGQAIRLQDSSISKPLIPGVVPNPHDSLKTLTAALRESVILAETTD